MRIRKNKYKKIVRQVEHDRKTSANPFVQDIDYIVNTMMYFDTPLSSSHLVLAAYRINSALERKRNDSPS
jgi:hypothetical protein